MKHVSLDIFDYSNNKIVNLFDSDIDTPGSAFDIQFVTQLTGWKQISFRMPYMIDKEQNWRWDYIKSEFLVRLMVGQAKEWFVITTPKVAKSSKKINGDIKCDSLASVLKTKNLYMYFDEDNGIGQAPYLMQQILKGTGWTFDEQNSDVFYENYAVEDPSKKQIKKRSITADTKQGAYTLIGNVCDLFRAYPIFDTDKKTVSLHALNNKQSEWQMTIGRNLTAITVEYNSDSIVTRLYVQGDYSDSGEYLGIDDVNPTGLSYLLNFDYYKSIGLFTDWHQQRLDEYYANIAAKRAEAEQTAKQLGQLQTKLSLLWGTQNFVLWTVDDTGNLGEKIIGGNNPEKVKSDQKILDVGDNMYVFYHDDSYVYDNDRYEMTKVTPSTKFVFTNENYPFIGSGKATYVMKWIQPCAGSIGAKQAAIEAKQQVIDECRQQNRKETTTPEQVAKNNATILSMQEAQQVVYRTTKNNEPQTFDYTVKITGQQLMQKDAAYETSVVRAVPNNSLSSTTYYLAQNSAKITTDETAYIYGDKTRVFLGDYGNTDILQKNADAHAIQSSINNLTDMLLDVSTAGKAINFTADDEDGVLNPAKFNGTTFTFTAKAHAYGLYEQYAIAVPMAFRVDTLKKLRDTQTYDISDIQAQFMIDMGDMLRDGYWADDNYIVGQQQYLYNDSLDVMKQVSKPSVKYSVSLLRLSQAMNQQVDNMQLNSKIKIYDPQLNVNDEVYVSKITYYLDDLKRSSVEISNEQVNVSSSFDSIFSRITSLADIIQRKKTLYDRAQAISSGGSLATDRLSGQINILTTKLSSAVSSWYTDDNGNIIFESTDGKSAMMLCGEGYMIANGKTDSGAWNWRTLGTGTGIVADSITTGYLSSAVIQAGSITVDKLQSGAGGKLDLSGNKSITLTVKDIIDGSIGYDLKIESQKGVFLNDTLQQIQLKAVLTNDGIDVTGLHEAELIWTRNSNDPTADAKWNQENKGKRVVKSNKDDVDVSATYSCSILLASGQDQDQRYYTDRVSVADLSDSNNIQMYLVTNQTTSQIYDPNLDGGYKPDWEEQNFVITPNIYINNNQDKTDPGATTDLTVTWKRLVGNVYYDLDDQYEIVDNITGKLTLTKNVMTWLDTDSVSYICEAKYIDSTVRRTVTCNLINVAEDLKKVVLSSPVFVFKQEDGVVNPNSIKVSADVQNTTITQWQYLSADLDESGNQIWKKIPGTTSETKQFTVPATSPMIINNVCTIRVTTPDEYVGDTYSLYYISDKQSDSGTPYYAYIRYSPYSDGTSMTAAPTPDTKYIGSYAGQCKDPSTLKKQDYTWTKYSNPDAVTVSGTKIEYIQTNSTQMGRPSDDDPGWTDEPPTPIQGYYIWTRTTVQFSNGSDMKTYTVVYNSGVRQTDKSTAYIRYSAYSDGKDMKRLPESDSTYIGIYTGVAKTAPTNYTLYTWYPLKATELVLESTTVEYAVTDEQVRPDTWQSTIPTIGQGQYLWTKSTAHYTNGQSNTTYTVVYSGTDGQNSPIAFLTNESVSFASNEDGKTPLTTVKTKVVAFYGVTATVPVIDSTKISGVPTGMSISVGGVDSQKRVQLTMTIAQGSTLGSVDSTYGQITIPVMLSNAGVTTNLDLLWSWSKINTGLTGQSGVTFTLYAPMGNVFTTGTSTLSLYASAYHGAENIAQKASFAWYKYGTSAWQAYGTSGIGKYNISIKQQDVNGTGLFKCDMTYSGVTYTATYVFTDKGDDLQAFIESSGGTIFYNDIGSTNLKCRIYKSGFLVNDDTITYSWSALSPDGTATPITGTTDQIEVMLNTVGRNKTYLCMSSLGTLAALSISVQAQIIVSATQPQDPNYGDVWLDTTTNTMWHYVKATADGDIPEDMWVKAAANQSDVDALNATVTTHSAQIAQMDNKIQMRVTTQTFNKGLQQTQETVLQQTSEAFAVQITKSQEKLSGSINGVQSNLDDYKTSVTQYMRFSDGTLQLGTSDSSVVARLSNDKLSFADGDNDVAYISNESLYITTARVTQQLDIGTSQGDSFGWWAWVVTQDGGIGLKWNGR